MRAKIPLNREGNGKDYDSQICSWTAPTRVRAIGARDFVSFVARTRTATRLLSSRAASRASRRAVTKKEKRRKQDEKQSMDFNSVVGTGPRRQPGRTGAGTGH